MQRIQRFKLKLIVFILLLIFCAPLSADSPPLGPPQFVQQWGGRGQAPGQLFMPWGIAVGPEDRIYVSDYGNNRIQVFSAEGEYLYSWGGLGSAQGQLRGPVGIAIGPQGQVYVADAFNYRVQVFDADGGFLRSWRGPSKDSMPFTPWGIAVDPQGQVYVTDLQANMVYKFSGEGQLLTQWGGFGTGEGQFTGPTGIAVSFDGKIYVVDSLGYRVQVFTPEGQFLYKWGSFCDLYIHPGLGCVDPDGPGPLEKGDGQFSSPWGIAFDSLGRVYIADSANKRIQVFTPQGEFLLKWGRLGRGPGEFDNPIEVALDSQGNIYVADLNNNRIQKFSFPQPEATTTPPEILAVEIPAHIDVKGSPVEGLVRFHDADGDLKEARFRVIDGKYDPFTIQLGELSGQTEGSFTFSVTCIISQQLTLKLVLMDQAGNRSAPKGFSFTCGEPPQGNYDQEQATVRPTKYTLGVNVFILADGVTGLAEGARFEDGNTPVGQPRAEVHLAIERQIIPAVIGIWDQCGVDFQLQVLAVVRPERLPLRDRNLDQLLFVRERELPEIAIADPSHEPPIELLTEALGPIGLALQAQGSRLDPQALSVFITGARLVLQPGDERNFGGVTTIKGQVSLVRWDDILVVNKETGEIFPPKRPITAIAHEFGHNFGLLHPEQQGIPQVAQDPMNLMLSSPQQPTAVPPQPTVNLLPIQCQLSELLIQQLDLRGN